MSEVEDTIQIAEDEITQLKQRKSCLETEWKSFPKEQDLKVAAKELEKKTNILEEIECKVQIQKGIVEKERKVWMQFGCGCRKYVRSVICPRVWMCLRKQKNP